MLMMWFCWCWFRVRWRNPDQVRFGLYLEEILSDGQQNQNRTRSKQKVLS